MSLFIDVEQTLNKCYTRSYKKKKKKKCYTLSKNSQEPLLTVRHVKTYQINFFFLNSKNYAEKTHVHRFRLT